MNEVTIKISSVAGNSLCIAADDREKVFKEISASLDEGKKVRLSFENVEDLTSAFLNASVGQLYSRFSEEKLKESMLPPISAKQNDLDLLKRVVERAKDFFKDPDKYKKAADEALGEDNG